MKGDPRLITALQARLAEETTAIQQYSAHLARVSNWGLKAHAAYLQERLDDERQHQKALMDRLELFDTVPDVGAINPVEVGVTVDAQLANDLRSESDAAQKYNATIALAVEVGDNDTRRILEEILKDEVEHIDDLEAQLKQIELMGLPIYLGQQIGG